MKIVSVVGARPQFVKLAPVDVAIQKAGHEHIIVHTGQHYDSALSDQLFIDLNIPNAKINLGVGSGSHANQTAAMMVGLEEIFLKEKPDWVLAYGDTNSTLAAALSAVKIHQPLAHLEAGLRSGNRSMPEEHNRVVTDHTSDLLLAPTHTAMEHLRSEGLSEKSVLVGDVMTDVCWTVRDSVFRNKPEMPVQFGLHPNYILSTIHRAENTDSPERLMGLISHLSKSAIPVMLVAHPRLIAKAKEFNISLSVGAIEVIPSMSYSQMVAGIISSTGIMTDSGGLQKEAFLLKTPCITLRTETEWTETLSGSWNVLDPGLIVDPTEFFSISRTEIDTFPFGKGNAAERTVDELKSRI